MVFGFTNTRISNYTPGDTYGPLKTLLQQHPDIGLELSTPTTYCFDSESFRYLAASKNGVDMPNKLDFDRSWNHSRVESLRLINHFKANTPHEIKNTLTLNGARELISELTKPIAEITQLIQSNISLTEDKTQELNNTLLTGDQLRSRLQVQKVQLNAVQLDMPRTVCGNENCVEVRSNGQPEDKAVVIYKTHCHPCCYLHGVQADQIAPPGLIECTAFGGKSICEVCGHHWQEHLHVLYELSEQTVTVEDKTIQQQLKNHADDVTLKEQAVARHLERIEEYKKEQEMIRDYAAKFCVFLRKSSLAPYNDALIAYLDFLIKEEQMKVQVGGNDKRLVSLMDERKRHKEAIEVITQSMDSDAALTSSVLKEGSIEEMAQQMFRLKHFGAMLKDLKQGIAIAHQATYREVPYTIGRQKYQDFSYKHTNQSKKSKAQHKNPSQGSSKQTQAKGSSNSKGSSPRTGGGKGILSRLFGEL